MFFLQAMSFAHRMLTRHCGWSLFNLPPLLPIRALSSSKDKKPPSFAKKSKAKTSPAPAKNIPLYGELFSIFNSPIEKPKLDKSEKQLELRPVKRKEVSEQTLSSVETTQRSQTKHHYARKKKEDVIPSQELLKDFLDFQKPLQLKKRPLRKPAPGKPLIKYRYTEPLPKPADLHLFDKSKPSHAEEKLDTGAYNNAVYDEIEALEKSAYRAKSTMNKFDQLIQWTLDGKLWRYPIDNEQDWTEEQNTEFHEHVFLDRFINRDAKRPVPLTAFMELVCAGLSQNPHLSASQKKEHLAWFDGYFADKVRQIESAVLEEKQLAEVEAKATKTVQTK